MSTELEVARADTSLAAAAAQLSGRGISALPVVDAAGALVGVVSRSDLLHQFRLHGEHRLAETKCAEIMSRTSVTVDVSATVRDAARLMSDKAIHRVFVVSGNELRGVVSCKDLCRVVADARLTTPLEAVMSRPVATVSVEHTLALATEWLDRARITGLVVLDSDWPVGVFTQVEALAARGLPPETLIDRVYDPALLCLPAATPIFRAAAQCWRMDARRIVVAKSRDFVGVVSGLDFAAIAAE